MKTNFFTRLQALGINTDLHFSITMEAPEQWIVSVLITDPKNGDQAAKLVPPMIFKGTFKELDEGFFKAFDQPAKETTTLFANMETFLKQREEAEKQSQMRKAEEATAKKEAEKRKDKYTELLKKVDELEEKKMYGQAIAQMPKAKDFPEQEKQIKERLTILKQKHGQAALFEE